MHGLVEDIEQRNSGQFSLKDAVLSVYYAVFVFLYLVSVSFPISNFLFFHFFIRKWFFFLIFTFFLQ